MIDLAVFLGAIYLRADGWEGGATPRVAYLQLLGGSNSSFEAPDLSQQQQQEEVEEE